MKTICSLFTALCLSILFSSCKKNAAIPESTEADVRVMNATPWIVYNTTVDPSGTLSDYPGNNAYNYGDVLIDASSAYHTFSKVYNYAWIRLVMNNKTYYLKPYDYTSETPLQKGRYTFKLTYTASNDRLNLTLIKD